MAYPQPSLIRGRGRGFRGSRGGVRGRPFVRSAGPALPAPKASQEQLEVLATTLLKDDGLQTHAREVRDVQYVASYNWIDKDVSTILVPGQPPKWLPPVGKQQLHEDSGSYYRDCNAANHPQCPTEPAVRAIYELNPDFNGSKIDIFGCGSTIGSLIAFVKDDERTFRFGVERVGKTVFLVRKTNTPNEVIDDVRGYGHSFPEVYTVWEPEVKGSSSHQRIISYDFAGLRCMIRTETDGYLPGVPSDKLPAGKSSCTECIPSSDLSGLSEVSDSTSLTAALSTLGQAYGPDSATKKLSIMKAGRRIDQQAIFDLKTRSAKRKNSIDLSEFLPRLWANQTSRFILAWHTWGVFDDIEVKDVRNNVIDWEQQNQPMLVKYHNILNALMQFSMKYARFEVRRTERGPLEIWSEVEGWAALPAKLKVRWNRGAAESGDKDEDKEGVVIKSEVSEEEEKYLSF